MGRRTIGRHLVWLLPFCAAGPSPCAGGVSVKPSLRAHAGPHGGELVSIEGVVSLEFVYDCVTGRLAAHVLNPSGGPLRLDQEALRLHVTYADVDGHPVDGAAARFEVDMAPDAGESAASQGAGAASFVAESPDLRGVCRFLGNIESLKVGKTKIQDVPFRYPGS